MTDFPPLTEIHDIIEPFRQNLKRLNKYDPDQDFDLETIVASTSALSDLIELGHFSDQLQPLWENDQTGSSSSVMDLIRQTLLLPESDFQAEQEEGEEGEKPIIKHATTQRLFTQQLLRFFTALQALLTEDKLSDIDPDLLVRLPQTLYQLLAASRFFHVADLHKNDGLFDAPGQFFLIYSHLIGFQSTLLLLSLSESLVTPSLSLEPPVLPRAGRLVFPDILSLLLTVTGWLLSLSREDEFFALSFGCYTPQELLILRSMNLQDLNNRLGAPLVTLPDPASVSDQTRGPFPTTLPHKVVLEQKSSPDSPVYVDLSLFPDTFLQLSRLHPALFPQKLVEMVEDLRKKPSREDALERKYSHLLLLFRDLHASCERLVSSHFSPRFSVLLSLSLRYQEVLLLSEDVLDLTQTSPEVSLDIHASPSRAPGIEELASDQHEDEEDEEDDQPKQEPPKTSSVQPQQPPTLDSVWEATRKLSLVSIAKHWNVCKDRAENDLLAISSFSAILLPSSSLSCLALPLTESQPLSLNMPTASVLLPVIFRIMNRHQNHLQLFALFYLEKFVNLLPVGQLLLLAENLMNKLGKVHRIMSSISAQFVSSRILQRIICLTPTSPVMVQHSHSLLEQACSGLLRDSANNLERKWGLLLCIQPFLLLVREDILRCHTTASVAAFLQCGNQWHVPVQRLSMCLLLNVLLRLPQDVELNSTKVLTELLRLYLFYSNQVLPDISQSSPQSQENLLHEIVHICYLLRDSSVSFFRNIKEIYRNHEEQEQARASLVFDTVDRLEQLILSFPAQSAESHAQS